MNEQEKGMQRMIEFCQGLIPNAQQLGLEQSESIAMISQAQTPQDLKNGIDSLLQELGKEQFAALTQAFQQSKSQNIKMAKKGTKIDYLINKFADGGNNEIPKVETKVKGSYTPLGMSFITADKTYLPKRDGTLNQRYIKRVGDADNNILHDRIYKDTGEYTERKIRFDNRSPKTDTLFKYNGNIYLPGDEMYDRYQKAGEEYGVKDHAYIPIKK